MNQSSWESPTACPGDKDLCWLLPAFLARPVLSARRSVTTNNRAIDGNRDADTAIWETGAHPAGKLVSPTTTAEQFHRDLVICSYCCHLFV